MYNDPAPYYQSPLKPFKPIPPRRPDLLEYAVRFVFGFAVGFVVLFFQVAKRMPYGDYKSVVLGAAQAAVWVGLVSMLLGDRFWNFLGSFGGWGRRGPRW